MIMSSPSRTDRAKHISTRQFARLVDEWVTAIGLRREDYGTHSLRRTKVSIIYKATGNLRAVQILLGHTKVESTVRYLGVDVEDALDLAEHTDLNGEAGPIVHGVPEGRPRPNEVIHDCTRLSRKRPYQTRFTAA